MKQFRAPTGQGSDGVTLLVTAGSTRRPNWWSAVEHRRLARRAKLASARAAGK